MPQILAIALIGGVAWFAVRAFRKEMARVGEEVRRQEAKSAAKEIEPLEQGKDGVYRPKTPANRS